MAGIYIHIPFCRQACHYCDFHFSTSQASQEAMVQAIGQELVLRQAYLQGQPVHTVYLGGGSPSLLQPSQLQHLLGLVAQHYALQPGAEITLEANPDDMTEAALQAWQAAGINRLSIGIQTFQPQALQRMNRAHTAQQSLQAVALARSSGITNLSMDLMYGLPWLSEQDFQHDVVQALAQQVPHISAYALTIEAGTAFGAWQARGKLKPLADDRVADQFLQLRESLLGAGYQHYEVSSYALPGQHSRHNASYWQGLPYLGVGPSAHSYNGASTRHITLAHNARYLQAMAAGLPPLQAEELSPQDLANEYLMTSLRTQWGMRPPVLMRRSGLLLGAQQQQRLAQLVQEGLATTQQGALVLSPQGLLQADGIAASLFF